MTAASGVTCESRICGWNDSSSGYVVERRRQSRHGISRLKEDITFRFNETLHLGLSSDQCLDPPPSQVNEDITLFASTRKARVGSHETRARQATRDQRSHIMAAALKIGSELLYDALRRGMSGWVRSLKSLRWQGRSDCRGCPAEGAENTSPNGARGASWGGRAVAKEYDARFAVCIPDAGSCVEG